MSTITIAHTHELKEDECKSFQYQQHGLQMHGFIVMQNGQYHAYVNRCPHTGVNLEWQPNQFLDLSQCYIQCATHGARFRIHDGLCIYGPCQGQSLTKLDIEITQGKIELLIR